MKHTLLAIAASLLASLIVLRAADGKPASAERPNIVFVLADDLGYDLFANESIKWISESKKGPFFLYWAMVVPPANNERTRELRDGAEVPDCAPYSAEDWPNPDKGQAAMIAARWLRGPAACGIAEARLGAKVAGAELDRPALERHALYPTK